MAQPVLRIAPKKYGGETTIISMRVARDMLRDLDKVAELTGRNRNEILAMSLEFALNHTEIMLQNREDLINGSNQV